MGGFNLRGRDYTCAGAGLDPRIECLDPSDTHNGKEHGNYRGFYGGSIWKRKWRLLFRV